MTKWLLHKPFYDNTITHLIRRHPSNGWYISIRNRMVHKDGGLCNGEDYDDHVKTCE